MPWLRRRHSDPGPKPARPAPLRGPFLAGAPGDQFDVLLTAPGEKKIQVIKVTRECTGYGLKVAKDLVDASAHRSVAILTRLSRHDADRIESALVAAGATVALRPSTEASGLAQAPFAGGSALDWDEESDRPPVAAWPAGPRWQLPADPAGDQFVVVLTAAGNKKIQVIKEIRTYIGYGLKESKDLVDASAYGPVTLTAGLGLAAANQLAAALTRAGATVTVTVG